jgi:hypothetical protein
MHEGLLSLIFFACPGRALRQGSGKSIFLGSSVQWFLHELIALWAKRGFIAQGYITRGSDPKTF